MAVGEERRATKVVEVGSNRDGGRRHAKTRAGGRWFPWQWREEGEVVRGEMGSVEKNRVPSTSSPWHRLCRLRLGRVGDGLGGEEDLERSENSKAGRRREMERNGKALFSFHFSESSFVVEISSASDWIGHAV